MGSMTDIAYLRLEAAIRRLADQTRNRPPTGRTHDAADDTIGTADTDDAVGFDPRPLLSVLDRHHVPAVVIGQLAGVMHGSLELTGDLDLLWDGAGRHARAFAGAFAAAGATLTDNDDVSVPCKPAAFALPKVQFRTASACGDCCTPALPWGDIAVAEFLPRCALAIAPDGTTIRYLALADLIAMRRAVGRPKDLRRAAELETLR
jgi:hypothetical protein